MSSIYFVRGVLQDTGLSIYIHCVTISINNPYFSALYYYLFRWFVPLIISIFLSIMFISHPLFMKIKLLYQSNDIPWQLCLCINLKKVYRYNQEYAIFSANDVHIHVIRSCLIRLIFQEYHFHQIHPIYKCQRFLLALLGVYLHRLGIFRN